MNLAFFYSLLVHILVGLLLFVSVPSWQKDTLKNESVPLWIDLKNVELAEKTNLPPKKQEASRKKENKQNSALRSVRKFEEVKPVQKVEKIADAAKMVTPLEKAKEAPKSVKKKPSPPPVKTSVPKIKAKPERDEGDLDSLLASVEKMSGKSPAPVSKNKEELSDMVGGVLDGFKGGTGFGNKATVGQIDFIAATVRRYWNFDAGIEGIENMVVVLQVALNPDGRVAWAKIEDDGRMEKDSSYRSVAESAKRAIYICDRLGDESPFRILAQKYPASYREWQRMRLRFNPLDGGVS